MSWVKHTDQRSINRKMRHLSDAAYRLDDEAIQWASRNMTDGRIPAEDFDDIGKHPTPRAAAELVDRGRWHTAEQGWCGSRYCAPPGKDGWVIHDYLEYNPSRDKAVAEREAHAERQRAYRDRRRNGSRDVSRDGASDWERDSARDAARDTGRDMSRAPGSDSPPSSPVPSRPQTGREGPPSLSVTPPAATRRAGAGGEQTAGTIIPELRAAAIAAAKAAVDAGRRVVRRVPPAAGAYDRLVALTPDTGRVGASPHESAPTLAGIVDAPTWHPGQAEPPHPNGDHPMDEQTAPAPIDPEANAEPGTLSEPEDPSADAPAAATDGDPDAGASAPGADATADEPNGGGSMGDSHEHHPHDDDAQADADAAAAAEAAEASQDPGPDVTVDEPTEAAEPGALLDDGDPTPAPLGAGPL